MSEVTVVVLTTKEGHEEVMPLSQFNDQKTVEDMLEDAGNMGVVKIEFNFIRRNV